MRAAASLAILLTSLFVCLNAYARDSESPYINITVQGLEEVAPPLDRLANSIEKLSQSDNISTEDQQKVAAVVAELKSLTEKLDSSVDKAKQQVSLVQQEISASVKQLITLAITGLLLAVFGVAAAIFILFRLQIAPLIGTTSASLDKFSEAMENLSLATKALNSHKQETN